MSTPITTTSGSKFWTDEHNGKNVLKGVTVDGITAEIGTFDLYPSGNVFAFTPRRSVLASFTASALRAIADLIDQTTNEQENR
ncbi:hypothetical protein DFO58_2155 [Arthrobacter sp. AG1021]|uniref:hypothetical protein n=1 Tax=Arthrobacter sp. AG1021 TaxID=2183908 RepID=UPI000EB599C6|nr:hypothetical protein [Arthrobacter sp. AG1021]RKS19654.1 hypothetical protein DFO58_2155 [Arthrobacter sp. AG1021]